MITLFERSPYYYLRDKSSSVGNRKGKYKHYQQTDYQLRKKL
ncbi:hypothetical protein [Prevotella pallens]|nr:hypothetical protein [Prevotella pallens]